MQKKFSPKNQEMEVPFVPAESSETPPIISIPKKVRVTAGSLNVRKNPDKTSNSMFRLSQNSIVEVLLDSEDTNWLFISTEDGRTGYVMRVFTAELLED